MINARNTPIIRVATGDISAKIVPAVAPTSGIKVVGIVIKPYIIMPGKSGGGGIKCYFVFLDLNCPIDQFKRSKPRETPITTTATGRRSVKIPPVETAISADNDAGTLMNI
jgi:hypothetical protein